MTIKVIKVNSCGWCPFLSRFTAQPFCTKHHKFAETEAIPDWCGLETYNDKTPVSDAADIDMTTVK